MHVNTALIYLSIFSNFIDFDMPEKLIAFFALSQFFWNVRDSTDQSNKSS